VNGHIAVSAEKSPILEAEEKASFFLTYVALGRLKLTNKRNADMLVGKLIRGVHSRVATRA
jgi:hypothetical protein